MITEDYCSFEIAKLLKEKGFNEPCTELNKLCLRDGEKPVLKVTHQKAMKWLREVYDIYIVFFHTNKSGWWYNITDMKDSYVFYSSEKTMCSCEEIVEAALKYSLENLI